MRFHVTHETRYDYTPAVETAQHLAYLRPIDTLTQRLVSHELVVDPQPGLLTEALDVFGNTRTFFSLQRPHRCLSVVASSVVVTHPAPPPDESVAQTSWESTREVFRYRAGGAYDSASEFVFTSPCIARHADFADFARPSFASGTPLLTAVRQLMTRIHTEFTYASQSTEVNTPALEALAQKRGVCQDFAHIMIACLRNMGLPARYVSGYLLTEPPPGQPRLIGADASHAWVSAYIPAQLPTAHATRTRSPSSREETASEGLGGGWFDFCPTNNRWGYGSPGEDYVTLAVGRDYADVSPMRGMIRGGAHHQLHVGVTVHPLPELDEKAPSALI